MKTKTKYIVRAGLFAALLALLSQVAIPTPFGVSLTLQTFAVSLTAYFLGVKLSLFSVCAYLLLGAAGVPVFSSFKGGLSVLAGPTGGFLLGFLLIAVFCGVERKSTLSRLISSLVGILLCFMLGVLQFSFVTKTGVLSAILLNLPFLPKDILSFCGACLLFRRISKNKKTASL